MKPKFCTRISDYKNSVSLLSGGQGWLYLVGMKGFFKQTASLHCVLSNYSTPCPDAPVPEKEFGGGPTRFPLRRKCPNLAREN